MKAVMPTINAAYDAPINATEGPPIKDLKMIAGV